MYAIAFDMDTARLGDEYPETTYHGAYADISKVLRKYGFTRQQGSVYFGDETVDAVTCVIATQELTTTYFWFASCVRDIRMLRIEDNNDLRPAVDRASDLIRGNRP